MESDGEEERSKKPGESVFWKRRKEKALRIPWVCSSCGSTQSQWWGNCPCCQSQGTLKQQSTASEADGPQDSTPMRRAITEPVLAEPEGSAAASPSPVWTSNEPKQVVPKWHAVNEAVLAEPDESIAASPSPVWTSNEPKQVVLEETKSRAAERQGLGGKDENLKASRYKKAENPGLGLGDWRAVLKRKGKTAKASWVCTNCGGTPGQWWGNCPYCQSTGTLKQFVASEDSVDGQTNGMKVAESVVRSWLPEKLVVSEPQSLTEVSYGMNQHDWRIPLSGLFGTEISRVLGGGLVPGSLVLVGGDPGVGKSTLLLQVAAMLAEVDISVQRGPVVYVSGEESIEQIGNRAHRMRIGTSNLYLYSSTDVEDILEKIHPLSPRALIVDSIQTVYLRGLAGSAGNVQQVKECTSALLRFAKQTNIPVFLVGHVTKSGDIAGPRVLEHIVDAVLYMEGERYSSHRLLRSVKNRFGSTDELGVFEMSQIGLQAVSNPSEIFLSEHHSDSEILTGLAVAVVLDGSRTFLVEIQALCISGSTGIRNANGVKESKADLIIAVLMKQAGIKLQDNSVFLNVVSGFQLTETAGDLAVAAAICSSFLEVPIPKGIAFIGEIGLGGELRMVPQMDKRVNAVAKLGYNKCIIPKVAEKSLGALHFDGMTVLGCRNLKEMIRSVFQSA
ncbi:hypothetical protein QJS10_CPA07g00887 [Acorus calamus]|uniref:RecA family profile 1 domain-containing protein n=1 Tax=Acorus calamus TaxID=4465 RepID=A0AAV9EIE2_ACOCL|nr:hypothetical protein QJS10_CPA07g00887 [Acorus calamus]